jgi:Nucleotidyl transferase AbiEii toxin, Type IV TA system
MQTSILRLQPSVVSPPSSAVQPGGADVHGYCIIFVVMKNIQLAERSARLEEPVSAGWIDVPLDSLADLVAGKMVALVERGAPRDFLDIYTLCQAGLLNVSDCWDLWSRRQTLAGSDADPSRARLAIETHLERIALHRPLEKIADAEQREQARQLRDWYLSSFLQVKE